MGEVQDEYILREQVDRSGFPLQIGLAEKIRSSLHEWRVIGEEYYWSDRDSGDGGFIDIVLEKSADIRLHRPKMRMAIECKKLKEVKWIFLIRDLTEIDKSQVRLLKTFREPPSSPLPSLRIPEWSNGNASHPSFESAFCVVPSGRQTLEQLCGDLLPSIECLAQQALQVDPLQGGQAEIVVYVPVIVTNARLVTCVFHPEEVDLKRGELQEKKGKFQEVPYVRFRKTLSTTLPAPSASGLANVNEANQRTVFVVRSTEIISFLEGFSFGV